MLEDHSQQGKIGVLGAVGTKLFSWCTGQNQAMVSGVTSWA